MNVYLTCLGHLSYYLRITHDIVSNRGKRGLWLSYIFYLATFGRMIQVSTTFVGIRAILKGGKYEPTILKKVVYNSYPIHYW